MIIPAHTTTDSEKKAGGKGITSVMEIMDPTAYLGQNKLFAQVTLKPGCSIGNHKHEGNSETYYILSGQAAYSDNGHFVSISKGATTFCPDGESHSIENTGTDDLVFIALIVNTPK